mmetsp:Transcript_5994/g.13110  ORF Transcript_5994/g.13110 Transcript_5994/m.13110 type:complete len:228 (-) Transcript_5994:1510-2193(-)
MASTSSMKTMHGDASLACLKMSRTLEAPTPTKSSINSEAEAWMNGTPDSPARAFAISVFPVPGGPVSNTPFGILAPTFTNRSGAFKKSTISVSSALASSMPATSSNTTPVSGCTDTFALLCPGMPGIPPGPIGPRLRKNKRPAITSNGKAMSPRIRTNSFGFSGAFTSMATPAFVNFSIKPGVTPGRSMSKRWDRSPTLTCAKQFLPFSKISTRWTAPSSKNSNKRE